jgi:hypothetical protein
MLIVGKRTKKGLRGDLYAQECQVVAPRKIIDICAQSSPERVLSAPLLRALLLRQLCEYHVRSFGRILSEKASTNSDVHAWLDLRRPMRQIKLYNPAELGSRKYSECCPISNHQRTQGELS